MVRRASLLGLAVALLTTSAGCWHGCGERRGLFACRQPCEPPGQLVGRNCGFPTETSPGIPIGSYPSGPMVPGGATVVPGGQPADVLPYPQPSGGLIPPPAVPVPAPAPPGAEVGGSGGFRTGQPVRGSTK